MKINNFDSMTHEILNDLKLNSEGIWITGTPSSVSYPAEGNEICFELEDDSFWFKHRNEVIANLLTLFPPSGTLFDIGGGNGFVARALQAQGTDTVVIEPGAGARHAKNRGLKTVIQASFDDLNFKDQSVSAFGIFDVLEHLEGDALMLNKLHSCLKPNGLLFLTVPAFTALWSKNDDFAGHVRRYTLRELEKKLKDAGFTVKFTSYFFCLLPLAIFPFHSLPYRLKIKRQIPAVVEKDSHKIPQGLLGALLNKVFAYEIKRLKSKKSLPLGSSVLAVAQKF